MIVQRTPRRDNVSVLRRAGRARTGPLFINRVSRALICIGIVVVLLGATPSSPSVTIADSGLTPPEVTVAAGGSVAWINRGTRQHEITAAGDTFPRFSLAPEGTRTVPFMKPGKYPYLLDGAVKGTVIVVGPGGSRESDAGEQLGTDGQSSTCRMRADATLTIYRYDVRVAVHREAATTGAAQQRTAIDWKASWVAPMSVVRCGGDVAINIPPVRDVMRAGIGPSDWLPGGQFAATIDLNEAECHYTYTTVDLLGRTWLRVVFDNPGRSSFDFLAGQDYQDKGTGLADSRREDEIRYATCGPHKWPRSRGYTIIGNAGLPLDGFEGLDIGDAQVHLFFGVPPDSPLDTAILDALAAGKGFNYDTGMQTFQDKGGTSSRVRATVSFSRLEN